MAELILVRHGETAGQSSVRLFGATDIPLAPFGERQASAAGALLRGTPVDHVVTSPLQRARRSAQMVLSAMALPEDAAHIDEGFREIDFGIWEGLTMAEIAERHPEAQARWRERGPTFAFPGGESRLGFLERVSGAVERSILPHLHGERRVLAVLHKGVIKATLCRLFGVEYGHFERLPCELASVHFVVGEAADGEGRFELVRHNVVEHLGDTLRMPGS